ncbi:MAG: manganese efflux pump, partial [Deltaproteobacteria bacterium]|nr:manganese efflux pump [Deltaproteobacteria bacterium]
QALMPIIGWAAALTVQEFIEAVDHWVAFGLLTLLGGRMIVGALRGGEPPNPADDTETVKEPTKGWNLVLLSFATSIDALAVGLSLGMLRVAVWFPALVIGLVAAALTALGLHLGAMIGRHLRLERYAGLAGGFILIAIGIRILHDHGVF